MFWKKILLLLLIVHTAILARGKRRVHKRDAVDPLLSEIFKSTPSEVKPNPVKDTRPDRSIDPNEELEALLTGFQNRNKHLFPQNSPAKRESGLEPGYNLLQNNADQLMTLNAQGSPVNTRDVIPRPQDDNLMLGAQIPAATEAQLIDDPNQNFMEQTKKLQQQQEMLNGIAAASLVEPQTDAQDPHEIQGRNIIPGRPNQMKNDWANQPGVSIYLHPDKKSTIPIPVKTQASAVANPGSFPVQMRRMSPNMKFGAVVPHHVEFGETVESVLSKPEDTLAKKSQIPHPEVVQASEAKKSDVQKGNSNTQQEASSKKEENPSTAEKKDFLQQPLTAQQFPQQQPAFQTTSQFAATQSAAAFATAAMPATPNVPVIPGQKCEDQYNQCPDFAKNEYCTKYPEQMSIQCRKSCKFCIAPVAPAVPVLDSKQQIIPAAVNVTKPSDDDSSGSGSGDSSGSGDDTNDVTQRKSDVKKTTKPSEMYLPELGSGSGSGSGSGDELSSGSEATIVKQLASAQNIVSGPGQQATATKTESSKKSHVPLMKKVLLSSKSSDVVKKSSIPQRPVSPLTAMDTENVSDDDDDSSASGSGSGSGDSDDDVVQEAVAKSTISVPLKPSIKVAKKPENSVAKKPKIKAAKNPKKVAAKKKKKSAAKKNKKSAAKKNKKSSIPAAPAAPAAPKLTSAYPRIDLRKIASALAHYEEAALTLAGEYPHIADQDNDVMTRSQIPRPGAQPLSPFNKLRQNIQIAKLVTQDSGKRYEIPKYLLVGDQITEKDGIASRSSIPSADSVESVASRFAVPGVKPSLQEFYAETGKPVFDTDAAKRMRIAKKKKKIQKPVDPFEYLRNMPSGASMEPIVDPHSKSSVRESVSYPVYLMKVMPGSHKYVAAAPRSKVVPHPKKTEAKVAPDASKKHNAPLPPLRPAAPVLPQLPPQSEFEFAAPSAPYAQPQAKIAPHPQTQIELGPPMFHSAPEVDNINNVEQSPLPQTALENQAYAVQQPQKEPAPENLKQSPPSLRTKMLSAFFQNKKSNEPEGSGSGMGEETNADTRSHISYDVSGPEQTQSFTGNTLSLQTLLSSEEGPGPESQRANQNAQHFYEAAPTKESNYLQVPKSDYLQSNLDALTPENAAAATQSAFSMQSGLSAGSPGARFTMSKTQETKWVKPDVGSELASILPETTSAAETRTIATQAPAQSFRPFVPSQSIVAAQAPLSNFHSGAVLQGLTTATGGLAPDTRAFIPMPMTNYEARLRSGPVAVASQIPQRKFQPAQLPSPSTTTSNVHKKNLIKHQPDLDCGDGWEGASGDFGTFCYKKMSVKTVFDDAQAECKGMNSHVFSILNPYENRYLQDNFHEKLWIGYRDKGMDGFWNWTDGSKGIYTNWAPEADDDNGQRRDCVMLQSDEGKWKDMPCGSTLPFLCKLKQGKCPKTWKKLNLNSVSGCYHMFQAQKNWEEAEQECESNDAHLVSILSEEEQTMIYQVYSSRNYWIGFNDKDSEGDWEWSDRSTSSFTNWDDNSPNNGGVSCAAFSAGGKWHDEPCMEKLPFICKRKGPKGEKVLGIDDEGFLKPVSRLLDKDEAARNEQISKGGPRPVVPSQYWPLLKNTKSGLSGNRPIAVHGEISNVYGGISLAGQNQYMDGGDFHGKCISDPDKCSKGLSVALQVFFEDEVRRYQKPHPVLDTSGGSKGFTIYIQNNKMHYKVITSEKVWELATDITTNRWEEIVMTWHNYKGITVFINGAFKDSSERGKNTGILREDATPRLLIGRRATDLKPFTHTKMAIASLAVFSKQLSIEDVTYAFTYDDTVVANYRWLMPHLVGQTIPSASEIVVRKDIGDMDGGLAIDGSKGWLEINDYDPCLKNPSECHHGFAVSFKLKLDQAVRDYKTAKYIIDSGGHKDGMKGISVYILNDNLYFQVIMSPEEDIMIWTVRTPIYTVRWQRVVMTWRLDKGLWVYTDGAFRGLTKTPKTLPTVFKNEPGGLVIGRKTVGPDFDGAEFGIGSFAIFSRFLSRQDTEHVFAVKDNPFPGLIREVWKNTPGSTMAQLKSNPDYPNNPSSIEVIENFDAPFDIERDYGSKLKGYFVAPETGNYTFYMSCSKSCELHFSGDEDTKNKSKLIEMNKATWHNQWNKFKNQSSPEIFMIAGKYYYLEAVQKGEESSDSLSVGVRMPSGRYQRPINKENLQWRLQGNPFAGVVREVWYEVPGYQVSDLTSDPNFPNNPSSTEIIDKFDAPFNIDDNYGSRLSGYFRAPETGDYRFYLAGDSTGELWISSDESESNLVKVVTLNGWTDHNQWLKFPEQRSDKIFLMAGKHYYIRAYQKADKLGDCVSVAVELPSGHFEGPIKKKHLSWKLPGGKVGPGPNDLSEALPKPVGLFPFNEASLREIVSGENGLIIHNIDLTTGPDGVKDSAFEFKGKQDSYLEIPNDGKLDTKNSITMLANIYPTGDDGPIINYKKNGWGVHMWQFDKTMLFVRFVSRDDGMATQPLATRVLQLDKWNQVGASYDNNTGVSQLWHDGKMVKSRNIGQIDLSTQHPIRVGARDNDDRFFKGKVACIQIYDKALTEQQIGDLRRCPKKDGQQTDSLLALTQAGSGSELNSEDSYSMENRVGEDTEEELAANHCDPNPCRNSAKCVNDERKVDGYKCVCTSDFTGKHCQVSKPAAENPVVKRMNIPKYPKEISSESYSKEAKKAKVKTAEDEREDIFLLYQKLGCYKDDASRRDLPNNVALRSTTQEECVRACAMQDKMYAYFGLQNGKNCFCGKSYGKYGKADDKSCSKRCAGNENENCGGDTANQVFFFGLGSNYTVKTFTGDQFGAGTDAKIFVELIGERGSSDFRQLNPDLKRYEPGSVDAQTFILPDLGKLKKIRVLHDNSGTAPSWFLKHMTVTDEEGNVTDFPCDDWLSDTQSGGKLERELISKSDTPKPKAGHKA